MSSRIDAFRLVSGLLSLAIVGCAGQVIIGDGADAAGGDAGPGGMGEPCGDANTCNPGLSCRSGTCTGPHTDSGSGGDGPSGEAGQHTATKVDLLFDIDNSASMGDKQAYLAKAVPDLVNRLVNPNCVVGGAIAGPSTNGSCGAYAGSTLEFAPVHDMHLGVISSSLGNRGVTGSGEVCNPNQITNSGNPFTNPPSPAIPSHTDDRGELLNRIPGSIPSETEGTSSDTGGQSFLDWFPSVPANAGMTPTGGKSQALSPGATVLTSAATLESDFQALLGGAHFYGCGIESQLESWYRFLVQPDPYDSIVTKGSIAQWSGVDATIIKQRHDFLRPDSLVAIIDLTDENDSEIDVRSFGGQGYKFMDQGFQPPRGTSACADDPTSSKCTSCAYGTAKSDPSCKTNGGLYVDGDDPGFYINVRHVHMQQKYGIVPQFPLGRYVLGLTSPTVPDRSTEYPAGANCYQGGIGTPACSNTPSTSIKTKDLNCTNPLFATSLPDGSDLTPTTLCNLAGAGGTRTADLIFYAHIGGVPHQLLQSTPGDGTCSNGTAAADCPQKDSISPADWVTILGQGWETIPSPPALTNPNQYDNTGIDPHMIESFYPLPDLPELTDGPLPTGGGPDPINGGQWRTDGTTPAHVLPVDREYACIFPLTTRRDCSDTEDYAAQEQCDCSVPGLPLSSVPSVCGTQNGGPYAAGTNEYTKQYYAKAYPTIREIELAELLGSQGVISSLCPIHVTDNSGGNDPLFGYRPAVNALVTRMKGALGEP